MTDLVFTKHSEQRLHQRGRTKADIEAVLRFGTRLDATSVALLSKDVDREVTRLKQEITKLERGRGWKVVEAEGSVITTYKPPRISPSTPRREQSH